MNPQIHLTMNKDKEREVTPIEITYNTKKDLDELASSDQFKSFILKRTLEEIEFALENNLEKIEIFNIFNLSLIIELERKNFKSVLDKVMDSYVKDEDFEKCNQIKKLINKL
tara:strand:+ start:19748 stop:20083 length:336 start_codon:yes stop_codon:yes gene_type:complete